MSKLPKFEIELPAAPKSTKLSLSERDIAMATMYVCLPRVPFVIATSDPSNEGVLGAHRKRILKTDNKSQVVVVHAFNPNTWEAEAGGSL